MITMKCIITSAVEVVRDLEKVMCPRIFVVNVDWAEYFKLVSTFKLSIESVLNLEYTKLVSLHSR